LKKLYVQDTILFDMRMSDYTGYVPGFGQDATKRVGVARFRVYDKHGAVRPAGVHYFVALEDPNNPNAIGKYNFVRTNADGVINLEYLHPTSAAPFDALVSVVPAFPEETDKITTDGSGFSLWYRPDSSRAFVGKVKFLPNPAAENMVIPLRHLSPFQALPPNVVIQHVLDPNPPTLKAPAAPVGFYGRYS
jgi:hypothetical protein